MQIEPFGQRMIVLLPQLMRGFSRRESNYLSQGKMTLPQLWALEYLSDHPACPTNELARFLRISRPAVTGLTDRLVAQGWVRRLHDPHDRRMIRLEATRKGRLIFNSVWNEKKKQLMRVFEHLSAQERSRYIATLEKVAAILSKETD